MSFLYTRLFHYCTFTYNYSVESSAVSLGDLVENIPADYMVSSYFISILKIIRVHHNLRKMFTTLVWKRQQHSFLFVLNFNPLLHYCVIQNNACGIKVYAMLHIKSSHSNFEVIVNMNRLQWHFYNCINVAHSQLLVTTVIHLCLLQLIFRLNQTLNICWMC